MSHRKDSIEWRDPTASEAIGNVHIKKKPPKRKPVSFTEQQTVEALSKFEDDSDWKGRRRLLRALHRELEGEGQNNNANKRRIRDEIRALSGQQFISRVTSEEASRYTGRRRY